MQYRFSPMAIVRVNITMAALAARITASPGYACSATTR
jgi:hypothetical protein